VNPHAGEQGLFGDEEARILEPAAKALGAAGPLPADTVFVRAIRGEFDAVLARITTWDDGNQSRGVRQGSERDPRTSLSPHFTGPGTALDIAGQGKADPSSMIEAVSLAIRLARKS
jgi:4-hydroxythreonine-4-phosphate dehydrogenase